MKTNNLSEYVPLFCVTAALCIGAICGGYAERWDWRKDTVERGYAHYCPNSGEWAWKDSGECDG